MMNHFDNIGEALLITDPNGNIISANPAACHMFERSEAEICQVGLSGVMDINDPRLTIAMGVRSKTGIYNGELNCIKKNGTTFPAELTSIIFKDSLGNPKTIIILRDISERQRVEMTLRESEEKFKAVFESARDGIFQVTIDGKIMAVNEAFARMHGYTIDELLTMNLKDLETPETSQQNSVRMQRVMAGKLMTFEVEHFCKSGKIISLEVSTNFVNTGGQTYFLGFHRDITARNKAEETIKKYQLLLKSSLESQKDTMLFSIDQDYRYLYFNKAHSEVMKYAYGSEIKLGMDILDYISVDDDRKAAKENYDRALQGESHSNIRIYGDLHLDYYESFFNPIVDDYNAIIGATGLARNITDRKTIEDALKLSKSRYKKAQEVGHIGSWEYDIKNNTFWSSDEGKRVYGFDPETDIFTAEEVMKCVIEKERVNQALVDLIEKNQPYNIVFDIIPLNSTQKRTINSIAELVRNENGNLIKVIGVMQDITARMQAEVALRESEATHRNLVERMPDGVYRSTHDGKFIDVNTAMIKMLGYDSKEELLAIDIKTQLYFEPADRESILLNDKLEEMGVYILKKKDGSAIWVEDHGWYIMGENEEILFHEGILRDITDRKRAEEEIKFKNEELLKLNNEKDKFFSIIAHDLRSPFQPLLGFTRMLVEDLPTLRLDEIQKMALNMRGAANKLFNLLENLLEWSRMQRGLTPFEPESFLILPKLSESLAPTLEAIKHKEIDLTYEVPDDLAVYADSNMFDSIIRNLVSNAIKFTAPKGKIEINIRPLNENWVEISVKDTGIGMNTEILENLFKLDTKTNRKGTDGEPSSGLGLIICKDFIENHGGKLWVDSEVNKGSTFYITLPKEARK